MNPLLWLRRSVTVSTLRRGMWDDNPIYRQILGALRDARLDGQVSSLREEEALAEKLLAEAAEGSGEG